MKKLCLIFLAAAMLMSFAACNASSEPEATGPEVTFQFVAVDLEGKETSFDITTNCTIVGEALQQEGLIEGEEGEYGLYVKTVNGITLDWDKDQKYWAFYTGEEYAVTGVDKTQITPGAVYTFRPE